MANKLKSISAETKAGINEILTPEQQQAYEAWKEAQKSG
jgi:Spy/CpxP family protein refolding chaperone